MKKVRQGQTVYFVDSGIMYNPPRPSVLKVFLHSRKQELPPEGCIIEKFPVSYVQEIINRFGGKDFYFSRRKAQAALKAETRRNYEQEKT